MNGSNPQATTTPRLFLHLFGSFETTLDGEPIRLPTHKIEALLAFLLLHPEPHAREKVASLFWGDVSDEQARVSLRYALGQLAEAVGSDLLLADRETVQLNPQFQLWLDVREFIELCNLLKLNALPDNAALPSLISLYSGDLLADFYDDWILPERERFRQLDVETLLRLTQQYRSGSDYAGAIETAQRVLAADPANERAHQHLMFCSVAQGNRHAALQQYEQCARALREELAIDPAPETTALYEWIKQARGEFASSAARITNLPIPLTSFVGRARARDGKGKNPLEDGG